MNSNPGLTFDLGSPQRSNSVNRQVLGSSSPFITVTGVGSPKMHEGEPEALYTPQSAHYSRIGGVQGSSVSSPVGNSIIVPSGGQDVDPYIVTVRTSPNKICKSNSSSFVGKTPPSVNSCKTGPRLALYRSNSSLDLLDRENYFQNQRILSAKISGAGPQVSDDQTHFLPDESQMKALRGNPGKEGYTGCFTRRKDFGSHGSIDMLSSSNTNPHAFSAINSLITPVRGQGKSERSGSLGGGNPSGHFLSLVATSVSRDRRGSFDISEESSASGFAKGQPKISGITGEPNLKETSSPRLRLKFQKLWESNKEKSGNEGKGSGGPAPSGSSGKPEASIFRKLRGGGSAQRNNGNSKSLPEPVKFDILGSSAHMSQGQGAPSGSDGQENTDSAKPVLRQAGVNPNLMEERFRRRVFAHFDCQSVSANISYAARLRGILSKRRNTTTGASAASLGNRPSSTQPSTSLNNIASAPAGNTGSNDNTSSLLPPEEPDLGDSRTNQLLLSCPYFRNEIGGEEERLICLSRFSCKSEGSHLRSNYSQKVTASGSKIGHSGGGDGQTYLSLGRVGGMGGNRIMAQSPFDETHHRPHQARGLSLLEWNAGNTHWLQGNCPYSRSARQNGLEAVDLGASYYRRHFYRQEHENWFGADEVLGPLAISIRREKLDPASSPVEPNTAAVLANGRFMYRLIVRSTELNTLRGSILEESIPGIKANSSKGGCHAKEVIEFLLPEIQLSCLKLGSPNQSTEEQLLKLDQQILTHRHKVGIMYCKAGQTTEEEMYNNEEAGPAFNEFLDLIGQRVRLKGFDKYTGGLDNKDDSTGLYSVYSQYQDCEIIFHVSTLLPFTANNRQQLMRKRHIGNDIVTIVFQEPGALPFTPKNIRSQFQHVFIIVRVGNPCSDNTTYSVAVSRSKEVPLFGPPIPESAKFPKNKEFVDFILAKVINAENATYRSEKFTTMATRTRQEYLKDLVASYSTNTSIDPRPKFSMLPFGNKKKDLTRPRFTPDSSLRGALSWGIFIDDNSTELKVEAFLAISADSFVIIDGNSREAVFAIPCSTILGWSSSTTANSLRVYYHQGECVTIHSKDSSNGENEDLLEILSRLETVTKGCETQEFILRRNEIGQLGFHVQQDGVVTEVETCGFAAKAGLKQGSRLVEICKVAVATLNQDQMIDFLKTSNTVVVLVVPPNPDGSPRRGCDVKHCVYTMEIEGEYENLNLNGTTDEEPPSLIHPFKNPNSLLQQVPGNHRKRYEPRSFSPPRSSNSSGYGTGSSSKSFSSASDPHFPPHHEQTEPLTSSSSGVSSSTDERWYDLTENPEAAPAVNGNSPPPIPARNMSANGSPTRNSTSIIHLNNYKNGMNGGYAVGPSGVIDKNSFAVKRDFFQRNNPHHGSFHAKLSPSRSHDRLFLKSNYGFDQRLRAFPSASVGPEDYAVVGTKVERLTNDIENGAMYQTRKNQFVSPLAETTVKGKVTYLTDFPLTHSTSSEHLAMRNNRDLNSMKNERLAALKSAYLLEKKESCGVQHQDNHVDQCKSRYSTTTESITSDIIGSEDELCMLMGNGKVRSSSLNSRSSSGSSQKVLNGGSDVKLRQSSNSSTPRSGMNRNSTLQEDLIRLISPEYLSNPTSPTKESEQSKSLMSHRPGSSGSVTLGQNSSGIKGRPLSIGSDSPVKALRKMEVENPGILPLLPDSENADWSTLVDTATKAFQICNIDLDVDREPSPPVKLTSKSTNYSKSYPSTPKHNGSSVQPSWIEKSETEEDLSIEMSIPIVVAPMFNLEARVTQLEAQLMKEQHSKQVLAAKVANLQQENRRLQEESSSTQHQFTKFKEWLQNTMESSSTSNNSTK